MITFNSLIHNVAFVTISETYWPAGKTEPHARWTYDIIFDSGDDAADSRTTIFSDQRLDFPVEREPAADTVARLEVVDG